MRLTFVVSNLFCGGAQRVASNMANYWAERGVAVTIITLGQAGRAPFFPLDQSVTRHDVWDYQPRAGRHATLWKSARESTPLERALMLRELESLIRLRQTIAMTRADAIISFVDLTNVRVLIAAQGLRIPVIVCEHSDPARASIGSRGWSALRRRFYPTASRLIVLTEDALGYFAPEVRRIGRVIPNAVTKPRPPVEREGDSGRILIGLGRLSYEKGFDLLVRAFARLATRRPSWSLEIWGDGPLRDQLALLIARLGLAGRAALRGETQNPHGELARASVFALPSRIEGFPVALCEAMALGLPAVCCDCSSGVRAIVRDGVDGLLCASQDETSLASGMDRLMSDDDLRQRLGSRAPDVISRFGTDEIMAIWEETIAALTKKPGEHILKKAGGSVS